MEPIQEDENQLSFNIDIDETYSLNDVFIHLKSEPLEIQSAEDIPAILQENRIVLKKDDDWYASKYSYAHLKEKNIKVTKLIVEIFKKYGNLYWYVYEKNNMHHIFVINKNLILNYYEKITMYYKKQYETININIFLKIDDDIEKSSIQNKQLEDVPLSEYSFVNDLYYSYQEHKNNFSPNTDMELLLPLDISNIIEKIKRQCDDDKNNNDKKNILNDEEISKFTKFKDLYLQLLKDKKEDNNVNIKMEMKNKIIELTEVEMFEIIELFEMIK